MRIATFNVQNLRLRHREGELRLDGARDTDDNESVDDEKHGRALDAQDRELTAKLIADAQADVIALQEVFDQHTLDHFHDELLIRHGVVYPHRVCLEGNDGRSMDVAVISRLPFDQVQSNANLRFEDIDQEPPRGTAPEAPVFRRDCLAVRCSGLHLFICHFKASGLGDEASRAIRRAEAVAVRHIIQRDVLNLETSPWVALGDFNAHTKEDEADLTPVTEGCAVDLCTRLPESERWTYYHQDFDVYTCPDRIFASHSLAHTEIEAQPEVLRMGLGRSASDYTGMRYEEVGDRRPHASDHALMFVDLKL